MSRHFTWIKFTSLMVLSLYLSIGTTHATSSLKKDGCYSIGELSQKGHEESLFYRSLLLKSELPINENVNKTFIPLTSDLVDMDADKHQQNLKDIGPSNILTLDDRTIYLSKTNAGYVITKEEVDGDYTKETSLYFDKKSKLIGVHKVFPFLNCTKKELITNGSGNCVYRYLHFEGPGFTLKEIGVEFVDESGYYYTPEGKFLSADFDGVCYSSP